MIYTTNKGKVIFRDYLGIYGNTIIIDHTMGLCLIYAHTSSQAVEVEDIVKENQMIGRTGKTGAVFGDHLHFGILVNGYEVDPIEWMDKRWIKNSILKVIKDAKDIID